VGVSQGIAWVEAGGGQGEAESTTQGGGSLQLLRRESVEDVENWANSGGGPLDGNVRLMVMLSSWSI
jgi:hypothetical protein